jgi:hypothetical protein
LSHFTNESILDGELSKRKTPAEAVWGAIAGLNGR